MWVPGSLGCVVEHGVDERGSCLFRFGEGATALETDDQGGLMGVTVAPVGTWCLEDGRKHDGGPVLSSSFGFTVQSLGGVLSWDGLLLADQEEVGQVAVPVGAVLGVLAVTLVHGADLVGDMVDDG